MIKGDDLAKRNLSNLTPKNYDDWFHDIINEYLNLIEYLNEIKSEWKLFIETGNILSAKHVKPEVISSWKRSMKMGVDPYELNPRYLNERDYQAKLKENRELIEIASPFLETLAHNLAGSGFRIDLFDKDLYILKQFGEPDVLEMAIKLGSGIGVSKAERDTGTNAINLAAILNRPVQLLGPEHFNVNLQYWTCASTPLFDKSGKLLGLINVAGHFSGFQKHTLGMVIALGKTIEFSWNQNSLLKEKELVSKYVENIVNSISDCLVALDKDGKIKILNKMAAELFGVNAVEAIGQHAEEILGQNSTIFETLKTGKEFENKELVFYRKKKNKTFIGNVFPVRNKEKVDGVVAVFKDFSKARSFVKKFAGFKAYFNFEDLIGNASSFLNAKNMANQAAKLSSNIMLLGESGTGKELFAQAIHNASDVRDGPFVGINCAAIPVELIESELFGYEGGAFTGARREGQPGKFQLAKGGTLFLDEVNTMSMKIQAKLLRVLQNRVFTRVCGSQEIPFEARIIAASNRDLWTEVNQGNFREDLFYRLNVISIEIPPLREHREDIPILIDYFCKKHFDRTNKKLYFSKEAINVALKYDWPGNVRELENLVEYCAILAYGRNSQYIEKDDLLSYPGIKRSFPKLINKKDESLELEEVCNLETYERKLICRALNASSGNISKAAKKLGISRKTLYLKLRKYDIR